MMVKVNLLPPEIAERARARKITGATVALVTLWVLLLGGIYMLKLGDVANAEQARDAAQTEVAALQREVAQLEEYRTLAQELETRNALLASAMEREISWARVLNDLALSFPKTSSLVTLNVIADEPVAADTGASPTGELDQGQPVAAMTFNGYTVDEYAPGVESVLVDFEETRGFFNSYLQTAGEKEIAETEVIEFNGAVRLDQKAFTDRYKDGLPPEVDQ